MIWLSIVFCAEHLAKENGNNKKNSKRVKGDFLNFLDRATTFYSNLQAKLDDKISQASIEKNEADEETYSDVAYFVLIRLGDLARYREQHSNGPNRKRTYAEAERWYRQAVKLNPHIGIGINQVGLICQMLQKKCLAACFYIHAQNVKSSNVDIQNLKQIYKSILKETRESGLLTNISTRIAPAGLLRSAERNALRKRFILEFSYFHAALYLKEEACRTDQFRKSLDAINKDLPVLLRTSAISREIQVSFVVLCIFSIQTADTPETKELALTIAFKLATTLTQHLREDTPSRLSLLVPLSIFVDFLTLNLDLVSENAEATFVKAFLNAITHVWKLLAQLAEKAPLSVTVARQPLAEEEKLAGFMPLDAIYRKFCSSRRVEVTPERNSNPIRASKIMVFCESLTEVIPADSLPFPKTSPLHTPIEEAAPFSNNLKTGIAKPEQDLALGLNGNLGTAATFESYQDFGEHQDSYSMQSCSPRSKLMDTGEEQGKHDSEEEEEVIVLKPKFGAATSNNEQAPASSAYYAVPPSGEVPSFMSPRDGDAISSPIDQLFNSANMLAFSSNDASKQPANTFSPFGYNAFTGGSGVMHMAGSFEHQKQWNDVQSAFAQPPVLPKSPRESKRSASAPGHQVAPPPGFY